MSTTSGARLQGSEPWLETDALNPRRYMQPEHLGQLKPSAFSFTRSLVRRMQRQRWQITPIQFDIDCAGRGLVIYRVDAAGSRLHFVIASDALADEERQERVIGKRWEVMGSLVTGELTPERIPRILEGMPDRILGRAESGTLLWCYAQRSGRAFDEVVAHLAAGRQPPQELLADSGYLLRNSGTYDNGLRGTPEIWEFDPDFALTDSHHTKMLALYLMRQFSFDLVEQMARKQTADAVPLDGQLKRHLGLGNASGVGLVLYVSNHPLLINRWIEMRILAQAAAMEQKPAPDSPEVTRLSDLIDTVSRFRAEDARDLPPAFASNSQISRELRQAHKWVQEFRAHGTIGGRDVVFPWRALSELAARTLHPETQETLQSLLIELNTDLVEALDNHSVVCESYGVQPEMTLDELHEILEQDYDWIWGFDMDDPASYHYLWYRSQENEEPRIAVRANSPELVEFAPDLVGTLQQLAHAVRASQPNATVGEFLVQAPRYRAIVQRVQSLGGLRYHTPHGNLLAKSYSPLHIMRFVLSGLYGLEWLEPKSERWVRGVLFQGAPLASDLLGTGHDDWFYPLANAHG